MFENIRKKIRDFGFTRLHRIERYLFYLKDTTKIKSKNDLKLIEDISSLIDKKSKKVKKVTVFLVICYLGVYFSLVSFFLNNFFLLEEITYLINRIIGFFGTTIFLIGIFVFSNIKNLYFQDLELLSSQLISLYTKYYTQDEQHLLKKNSYKAFIDFYNK